MKLHLYILRELLVGLAFTLGGMLVLTLPVVTAVAVRKLPGVEIKLVLMYIPLILAGLIPYLLPLAFLLAVVNAYGRLAADNEWTAIRMSGRNPLSCFLPGAVMAIALGILTLWLVGNKLPEIRTKQSNYRGAVLSETFRHFSSGRTEIHVGDFYVSAASREGDDFVDAFVYVPPVGNDKEAQTLLAERVRFVADDESIYAYFTNARTFIDGQDFFRIGSPTVRFDLGVLREKATESKRVRFKKSIEMRRELDSGSVPPQEAELYRYEIQGRRATASTCLMFLLLGAPTALLLRRGTQLMAMAVAISYVLAYYLLSMRLGKILAQAHVVPPELAAWTVAVVGFAAGTFLTWKALRE